MARPRNQARRRRELIEATESAVSRRGLNGVRLRDVAEAAGMTPGAILYYYDGLDELFFAVYERGVDRFCRAREEAIAAQEDPVRQLATAVHLGVPPGGDDPDIRLLYEFEAVAFRDSACAALMHGYVERQVLMYASLLDHGARAGVFRLASDARAIARNVVALEDAHGVYVLTGHREPVEVERLVLDYVAVATGVDPAALEAAREAVASEAEQRPRRRRPAAS